MKIKKAKNTNIGMKQRNVNAFGSPRLDSMADKMDGTEESHSHADVCRIMPKNITATMKPRICNWKGYSFKKYNKTLLISYVVKYTITR